MTGTAVKRSRKEVPWDSSGSNLGFCTAPRKSAAIAMAELMTTKTTASNTDTAEVNLKESAITTDKVSSTIHCMYACIFLVRIYVSDALFYRVELKEAEGLIIVTNSSK